MGSKPAFHLIKLCVGADSIDDLADWQRHCLREARARGEAEELVHVTRQAPRRAGFGPGSSLYWVIKGFVRVRQRLIACREAKGADGAGRCALVLSPKLIPTQAQPRRPFQGWRYLDPKDAPPDLDLFAESSAGQIPPEMRRELAELRLI